MLLGIRIPEKSDLKGDFLSKLFLGDLFFKELNIFVSVYRSPFFRMTVIDFYAIGIQSIEIYLKWNQKDKVKRTPNKKNVRSK